MAPHKVIVTYKQKKTFSDLPKKYALIENKTVYLMGYMYN